MGEGLRIQLDAVLEQADRLRGCSDRLGNTAAELSAVHPTPEIAGRERIGLRLNNLVRDIRQSAERARQLAADLAQAAEAYRETERQVAQALENAEDGAAFGDAGDNQRLEELGGQFFR